MKVCVTGASGYIASHLTKQLLEKGYTVHATVRNPSDDSKVKHLKDLPGASDRLVLFKADLVDEGSFDEAIKGTVGVFHTASPFFFKIKDPQKDVLNPAVDGTLNVLKAVAKEPSVKRVVLTSSMAAVGYNAGKLPAEHVYSEKDWSLVDVLKEKGVWYPLSKTLAEKAAWEFAAENKIDLVVINPTLVVGPILQKTLNQSSEIVLNLLNGSKKTIPQSTMGFVDVRDVAEAHILAYEKQDASGRYLMIQVSSPWEVTADILRKITEGKKYKIPTVVDKGDPPKPMLFESRIETLLGRPLIPYEESLKVCVESLEAKGFITSPKL